MSETKKTETAKNKPDGPKADGREPGAGSREPQASFEAAQTPEKTVAIDDRTKEDDMSETKKTETAKNKPDGPKADGREPGAGSREPQASFEAAQTPEKTVAIDDRTKELLRIVNNAERTFIDAMGHLMSSSANTPSGASDVYAAASAAMKDMAQGVRNATMNHAIFVAAKDAA